MKEMKEMMLCPHLEEGKKMSMCNASMTLMVPSMYEIGMYCTTTNHRRCPILAANTMRNSGSNKMIDVMA
ncbi:MAG: hypothetical protein HZB79_05210 [Deltaproteobacteria bacterium]|nr:hypothetical protein [Deltaproteobacteria bacterium]